MVLGKPGVQTTRFLSYDRGQALSESDNEISVDVEYCFFNLCIHDASDFHFRCDICCP
jgi:hypothetical protein